MDSQPSADFVAKEEAEYGVVVGATAVGGFLIYLGIVALDPTWKVGPVTGHGVIKLFKAALSWLSEHTSATVRGCIVIGIGVLSLVLAILMVLDAVFWRNLPSSMPTASRPEREGKGHPAWKDINAVHDIEKTPLITGVGRAP